MSRQLPNSIEAEQALLSSMLVYPSAVNIALEQGMHADEFYVEAHKRLFTVMMGMQEEGKPIDAPGLISRCNDLNVLSSIGGVDFIMELSDTSVSSANTKYYIELIQNKSYLRNLILTAQTIADEGFNSGPDIDEVMDRAEKQLLNVTRTRRTGDFRASKEVVSTVVDNIQKMSTNRSAITGTATGYRDLDRCTNGFQKGDLIILAARPSMGKTAFALNLTMNAAQINNEAVALFSLEMPAEQLISRMLSAKSRIPGQKLRTGYLVNNEWNQLNEAATELRMAKIFIDDSPGVRVAEIFSKCRKLQAEHGLCMIVIDYIQLISGSGRNSENRQQEVSEISRSLKSLARELKVPVIALSQLSRTVEHRTDKHPMLSDLRESGALEQDADLVVFLYRDAYYNRAEDVPETEEVDIDIAKHRNGPTQVVKLAFERTINSFYNYAEGAGPKGG
ncbi:MAG TPA: replicative DNA helicase [Erysipelotrichaceae bacterium]|nr:MAG: replicative DNA helicase [Firmicutes bacterium GWE2_51_13]HBZ40483.1 replicative DNA helicase [Erysipelotrichaceae bacterium]